ncbi:hypothetical protein D9611_010651 [Ephemerocybe angulata]|uniref:F-box domain-containing protein n=1 Tax=Ephemerocybe angulata TaxID=980116 RepID=A0A8H5BV59_9AGAR|nr:hypothetical protein D9611_010651 [Tulosesus angulatus]
MSENRSRRGFLYLPLELHLCIIEELDAPDLLNLGQTCNAIRSTINQRRVWEAALRATCRLNQLFEPSYHPIEDLDILELQRAALEPWRRSASFTPEPPSDNPSGGESSVTSRNTLQKKIVLEGHDDYLEFHVDFEDVCIVPGGRYILGMTTRYIALWDVGQTGKGSWSSRPDRLAPSSIARATPGKWIGEMSAPKAANATSFRFATTENNECFHVYEVGPLPDVCSIREIASLQGIPRELYGYKFWLQGDSLVCHFDEGIVVWDFIQSRYTAIKTRGNGERMITSGNLIVAFQDVSIGVWTIPPLKPLEPTSLRLELQGFLSRDFTAAIDFDTIQGEVNGRVPWCRIYLPSPWYSYPPTALEYATISNDLNALKIERFLLDVTHGAGSCSRKTLISSSQPVDFMNTPHVGKRYRTICGSLSMDNILQQGFYLEGLRAGMFHSVNGGTQLKDVVDIQYAFKDLGITGVLDFSHCPPTGRAAYMFVPPSNGEITLISLLY